MPDVEHIACKTPLPLPTPHVWPRGGFGAGGLRLQLNRAAGAQVHASGGSLLSKIREVGYNADARR
jgi:hypothetical protein